MGSVKVSSRRKTFQVRNKSSSSCPGLFIGLDCVINFCCKSAIVRKGFPKPHTSKMADETTEETQFVVDEVSNIIKESIESTIGGNSYVHNKVNQWTNSVVESCLASLTKLQKPFKYIVTCVIMQKNGAGLHTASSCYWDNSTDGSCTVRWENKTMYCIVSVFGLAI